MTTRSILLIAVVITLAISILLPLIHIKFNCLFSSHNNSANEYREFLFGICCLFYSYIILKKVRLDTINQANVNGKNKMSY